MFRLETRTIHVLLLISIMVLGAECGNGSKKTTEPTPAWPRTIAEVIAALRKSYVEMKYDDYAGLFDSAYTFVFAPQDVGQGNPESWGLPDELLSARHMFSKTDANLDGNIADRVALSFITGPAIPDSATGWTKVVLSNVFLTVYTHSAQTNDPLYYMVEGDQAYLWFAKTGDVWRIVRWEDKPVTPKQRGSAGLTQPSTWGQIKGLYR